MTSNDVALISIVSKFDEKSARVAAEKAGKTYDKAMRDIGKDTFENELVDQFNKAVKIVTGKLKNVNLSSYNANLLEVLFSNKEIDEKKKEIENFIGTILKINGALKGLPSNSFDNLSTAKLDQIVKQQEKIIENNKKISDERKSLNRSATSTANKNKKTSTIEKDYTIDTKKNAEISESLNSIISKNKDLNDSEKKNVDTLSRLLSLYDAMAKVTPEEGTKEAIRYSKDLLTVVKEIKETSEKVDLFTNKKASNYIKGAIDKKYLGDNLENVNESYLVSRSKQNYVKKGLEPLTSKQAKLEKNLTEYISNAVQKSLEKITVTTEQVLDKAQKKVEILQDSIDSLNSKKTEKPIIDNLVDESEVKSLEDIEDRLLDLQDKYLEVDKNGYAVNDLDTKELKEFIDLYNEYISLLPKDNKFESDLPDTYKSIIDYDDELKRYADNVQKINKEKQKLAETEVKSNTETNTSKYIEDLKEQQQQIEKTAQAEKDLQETQKVTSDTIININTEQALLNINAVKESLESLPSEKNIKISVNNTDYSSVPLLSNEEGKTVDMFRGVKNAWSGLVNDKGIGFFTDKLKLAVDYADELAKDGKVIQANLALHNPLEVEGNGARWDQIDFEGVKQKTDDIIEKAKQLGYDGVIFKNILDGFTDTESDLSNVVAVFDAMSVKNEQVIGTVKAGTGELTKIESTTNSMADTVVDSQNKIQSELKETQVQAEETAQAIKEVSSAPQESNISFGMKDAFPDSSTDTKPEAESMEQVEKATEEAVQAKRDFATANEGVQSSINDSENPLKLEAELMEQIAKSAREAANAKKEFVEANKQVKDSADGSNNDLADGHFENAESSGVKKYKKKGYKAHDTGNHDNEKKVLNKAELGKALKDLQSEIIASIDESTSFIKEVTDFYDSQDNLVKTQMKVGDKNGSMRTYTTSYSMDKDGNATAWTSHIETQKIAEQAKQEEKLTQAMAKGREQSEKARQAEQKRQELAQNNAINKALEEEYRQRQKVAQEEEKQIQKNKELAISYTESTSKKLSDAISKYSYGDSSDATAMMKQMNRGLSNFGDLSNIDSNIKNFDSIVDTIITDLKHSHEESLFALNNEIKAEETRQKQKDAFNKSNLNAIDMEIKKREEEAKAFSNSLKAQMESQQQAESQMSKFGNTLSKYQTKTSGYDATIARFNDGGWTSDTYLKNVQAVRDAVKQYATLLDNIKTNQNGIASDEDIQNLDKYEKKIKDTIATVSNMSASEKGYNFVSGQKELDKIHKLLNENSKMSSDAKAKIKAYYEEIESGNPSMSLDRIHGEIMKIYNAEVEAGRAGKSLWDTFKISRLHQLVAQVAGMFSFYDIINGLKQVASTVTELNTQITELAKVSEQSSKQIYADFDSYADIAKEVRGTISDTIAATADWSKNGYSIPDAKQLAEISQLYKNVGDGIDIDTANESLISTLKGFQLEADQAEHIVDVFNEVSNNEAISSGGIGEALQRSAASFNAASTSLEKSVSLVTATNSVLQNPEKVGNMWRTVSARLRGSETELKEMGEDTDGLVTSTSKLQALVKGITGFDIMKDKDTYKDIYDIVLGIGEKWQDLSDIDRASLLEALAGKQQSNALAAALSNIDVLKKSYEEATNAEGSAREENEEYAKSIQASIDQTKAKLEELANDTLNSNFLKGAIDAGGKLIDILDGIVDSGNAIPTVISGIAAVLSAKNNFGKCYVSA